eukprot:scaffold69117_cov67-Phaeocystis_antarctica.AAC.9
MRMGGRDCKRFRSRGGCGVSCDPCVLLEVGARRDARPRARTSVHQSKTNTIRRRRASCDDGSALASQLDVQRTHVAVVDHGR